MPHSFALIAALSGLGASASHTASTNDVADLFQSGWHASPLNSVPTFVSAVSKTVSGTLHHGLGFLGQASGGAKFAATAAARSSSSASASLYCTGSVPIYSGGSSSAAGAGATHGGTPGIASKFLSLCTNHATTGSTDAAAAAAGSTDPSDIFYTAKAASSAGLGSASGKAALVKTSSRHATHFLASTGMGAYHSAAVSTPGAGEGSMPLGGTGGDSELPTGTGILLGATKGLSPSVGGATPGDHGLKFLQVLQTHNSGPAAGGAVASTSKGALFSHSSVHAKKTILTKAAAHGGKKACGKNTSFFGKKRKGGFSKNSRTSTQDAKRAQKAAAKEAKQKEAAARKEQKRMDSERQKAQKQQRRQENDAKKREKQIERENERSRAKEQRKLEKQERAKYRQEKERLREEQRRYRNLRKEEQELDRQRGKYAESRSRGMDYDGGYRPGGHYGRSYGRSYSPSGYRSQSYGGGYHSGSYGPSYGRSYSPRGYYGSSYGGGYHSGSYGPSYGRSYSPRGYYGSSYGGGYHSSSHYNPPSGSSHGATSRGTPYNPAATYGTPASNGTAGSYGQGSAVAPGADGATGGGAGGNTAGPVQYVYSQPGEAATGTKSVRVIQDVAETKNGVTTHHVTETVSSSRAGIPSQSVPDTAIGGAAASGYGGVHDTPGGDEYHDGGDLSAYEGVEEDGEEFVSLKTLHLQVATLFFGSFGLRKQLGDAAKEERGSQCIGSRQSKAWSVKSLQRRKERRERVAHLREMRITEAERHLAKKKVPFLRFKTALNGDAEKNEVMVAHHRLIDTEGGSTTPDTMSCAETDVGEKVRETRRWGEEINMELAWDTCAVRRKSDRCFEFIKDDRLAALREETNGSYSGYCGELDSSPVDGTGTEDDDRWTSDEEIKARRPEEGSGGFRITCRRLQRTDHKCTGRQELSQEMTKKGFGARIRVGCFRNEPTIFPFCSRRVQLSLLPLRHLMYVDFLA
ncbi:conserved hypothetical protein [Neospora caninum Liverpool]|uniref:Uncharacterized protein n=1 Tax=Neospora caninum (strain Liverpool) TaxID=572307 RepID=F0VLZ0_NEOCL|nr:conserved hypothetical protein [Neospora caninum Liverpool]CBZ54268.1 conserved hypothetical protein [Neospora caninum Liverpool]CEL68973.1 TPA: hypothetical protein BN1204_047000 [Neospora caninum Liverpool]|eukprot:XP_003884299.1 conserved hypothetical protein [Neospora caninum Liverpool]